MQTAKTDAVNFEVSREDRLLIDKITGRAVRLFARHGIELDGLSFMMDVTACHANGCPLRLAEFAEADDTNFAHDAGGIRRHIDRETGKLTGCFLPRFYDSTADSKQPLPVGVRVAEARDNG
jgi:hypothetical protein